MDARDAAIINQLQGGVPITERPYAEVAKMLDITEKELIERLENLLTEGFLSRFGPMYHAERLGGGLTLAALHTPDEGFDRVTEQVNRFPEVAHNYQREHHLNMWFVLATETPERVDEVLTEIERKTGCRVYNMPKIEEFFVELRFEL